MPLKFINIKVIKYLGFLAMGIKYCSHSITIMLRTSLTLHRETGRPWIGPSKIRIMSLHNSNMMSLTKIKWQELVSIPKNRRYLGFPLSISWKSLMAQEGTKIKETHSTMVASIINKMGIISRWILMGAALKADSFPLEARIILIILPWISLIQ